MSGDIAKYDVTDVDFVDADELISTGGASDAYKSSVSVTSTTASTKTVTISGWNLEEERDTPTEAGDLVVLTGTGGGAADGTYTLDNPAASANTFTVVESIADSTGGSAEFRYAAGALKVGVDTAGLAHTSADTVQEAIEDLDSAISGGGTDDKKVKVSSDDTTPDFLENKLAAGLAIDLEVLNAGGDEEVQISVGFRRQFLLGGM